MSATVAAFLLLVSFALLSVPRQWAWLPLLAAACYMPLGEGIVLGPFNFYIYRLLLALALLRLVVKREWPQGGVNRLDQCFMLWCLVALITAPFHEDAIGTTINRLGMVYTAGATYFAFRAWCADLRDVERICFGMALLILPIALSMLYEVSTGFNIFSIFGGVSEWSEVRDGRIRAQGPFSHAILAGTAGATSLPLMLAVWTRHRRIAVTGALACVAMIIASGSSGPLLSAMFGLLALLMWRWRAHMRVVRWSLIVGYVLLDFAMNAPAYYIIARFDLTGSSTSWHRAALIDAALTYLPEWWLYGSDYTRHWMAYGGLWSGAHADITNQYVRMGVDGGLPLLFTFILVLAGAFSSVGRAWRSADEHSANRAGALVAWALGCALTAHAAAFVAVSYFDQSVVLLYLTLSAIAAGATAPEVQPQGAVSEPIHHPA
jgi:hypothetical protein